MNFFKQFSLVMNALDNKGELGIYWSDSNHSDLCTLHVIYAMMVVHAVVM